MISGINQVGLHGLSCFCHTLQLCINDTVFKSEPVSIIIRAARQIVGHFSHSPSAQIKFNKTQSSLGLPDHVFIQNVSTR